jgi:hypothetical protein
MEAPVSPFPVLPRSSISKSAWLFIPLRVPRWQLRGVSFLGQRANNSWNHLFDVHQGFRSLPDVILGRFFLLVRWYRNGIRLMSNIFWREWRMVKINHVLDWKIRHFVQNSTVITFPFNFLKIFNQPTNSCDSYLSSFSLKI